MDQESAESVITRLCMLLHCENEASLAKTLGIGTGTISNWKKRDSVPYKRCVELSKLKNASLEWLLTGKGEMYSPSPADGGLSMEQVKLLEMYSMLSDEQKREIIEAIGSKQQMNSELKRLQNEIDSLKKAM